MRGFNWRACFLVIALGLIQASTLAHAMDHQSGGKLESSCLSCASLSFATLEAGGLPFDHHAGTCPALPAPAEVEPAAPRLPAQPRAPPHSL